MMANRGALGKILSTLSRKPPCPGNILPVSSLLELLLKTLTVRSPTTEYKPIHKEDKIIELERRDHREIAIRPHPHEFYLYFDV